MRGPWDEGACLQSTLYNVFSVHRGGGGGGGINTSRDTLSTSEGCHEYIGRCSVHQGDMMHVGEQGDENLSISIENLDVLNIPSVLMVFSDVLMISPNVLMISPDMLMVSPNVQNILQCTHDIPRSTTEYPQCTHDIPVMYSWYPPDVLNISRCTENILHKVQSLTPDLLTSSYQ